jgi:hypothetical protein
MKPMRVYVDTSVFGGFFDAEYSHDTQRFFEGVFAGKVILLLSDTLARELIEAPEQVQDLFARTLSNCGERLPLTAEAIALQEAYVQAGVVTPRYMDDALHVAQASPARSDAIVSWNFRHLVNPTQVRAFNGVNVANGYPLVLIVTPSIISAVWEESDE